MFRPDEKATEEVSFEIDPQRGPLFQIMQLQADGTTWVEVGFVWSFGNSRTAATEYWWLYNATQSGDSARTAYTWPGFNGNVNTVGDVGTAGQVGTTLQLVPYFPPAGQNPSTMTKYLSTTFGVGVTPLKNSVSVGI